MLKGILGNGMKYQNLKKHISLGTNEKVVCVKIYAAESGLIN
jgi:hypothetical protein